MRYILQSLVFLLLTTLPSTYARAQSAFGGEIVSYHTFGEGLSVTRAKVAPIMGTVSNIFFYNRADEPWVGNEWFEYDWELRGGYSENGMSQIRVRPQGEEQIVSTPSHLDIEGGTTAELLHYILIRKDNRYVYDVRREFNVSTYNFNIAGAHNGNSASALINGPRIVFTDDNSDNGTPNHIPAWKELDFSLGVTAFDIIAWSGPLPDGDFDGVMQVDFTRFYTYSDNELNTTPQWSDEFIGTTLDFGKWSAADWTFHETQFRLENIKVQGGSLFLRVNRGGSIDWDPTAHLTLVDRVTLGTGSGDTITNNPVADADSVIVSDATNVEVTGMTSVEPTAQGGGGAFGWTYLLLLVGLGSFQRRFNCV